jgi:hypothetical protein
MKIIVTKHSDHYEVQIKDGCLLLCAYTFDDKRQVEAFCSGFQASKTIANNLIQSMPLGYEMKNS